MPTNRTGMKHFSSKFPFVNTALVLMGLIISIPKLYFDNAHPARILQNGEHWLFAYLFSVLFYATINMLLYRQRTGASGQDKFAIKTAPYLGIFFFINPIIEAYFFSATDGSSYIGSVPDIIFAIATALTLFFIIRSLREATGVNRPPVKNAKTTETELPSDLDKTISLVAERAAKTSRMMLTSLVIMFVIVLIGGWASIGTVALDEFKNVRRVEGLRIELVKLTDALHARDTISFNKALVKEKYGEDKEYKMVMKSIDEQSKVSWQDIVRRVAIAVLTLFLVQVFFNIYKYNQQQASHLFSKIETMELYRQAEDEKTKLRESLLEKLEPAPTFEKGPTPPTEQIINMLEKFKKD